ncbi:MAG: hypothetical protein MUC97_17015 [Bernardetiaceae bacterium]|jgi:hypothetical protein|nr:hypothetical protein [Bernardetiaceae bacterium]
MHHGFGRLTLGLLLLGWLTSCASLPNLQGFAEESGRMSSAIQKGYVQAETGLARADTARARRLRQVWQPTQQGLSALVAYADALASLAAKGNDNAKTAKEFASKFERATKSVTSLIPVAGLASGEMTRLVEVVSRQLIVMKTQRTLSRAVREAVPVVDQMVKIIDLNLQDLALIHAEATEQQMTRTWLRYSAVAKAHEAKTEEAKGGLNELAAISRYRNTRKRMHLEEVQLPPGPDSTLDRRLADREKALNALSGGIDASIKALDNAYKDYQKATAELNEQLNQGRALIYGSRDALAAWNRTHGGLEESLALRHAFSVQELVATVQNMYQLYDFYQQPARPSAPAR